VLLVHAKSAGCNVTFSQKSFAEIRPKLDTECAFTRRFAGRLSNHITAFAQCRHHDESYECMIASCSEAPVSETGHYVLTFHLYASLRRNTGLFVHPYPRPDLLQHGSGAKQLVLVPKICSPSWRIIPDTKQVAKHLDNVPRIQQRNLVESNLEI
jgi:hypothetical protein